MERKPYYVLRLRTLNLVLHEGIAREVYPHSGGQIQLYLTDEEVQKYNSEAINEILRPYVEIIMKRYMYIPVELILYAISAVIFGK
jgi:hypothetical protein